MREKLRSLKGLFISWKSTKTMLSGKLWIPLALAFAICLLIECICFNYNAILTAHLEPEIIPIEGVMNEKLLLKNLNKQDIETIRLSFRMEQEAAHVVQVMTVSLFFTDDTHRYQMEHANDALVSPGSEKYSSAVMKLSPSGTLHDLLCSWDGAEVVLEEAVFNAPIPYRFHVLRFFLLLTILEGIIVIRYFKLWKIRMDYDNVRHQVCYALTMLAAVALPVYFFVQMTPENKNAFDHTRNVAWPFQVASENLNELPHVLAFDAMMNRTAHLRVPEDEYLATLENPYDRSQRDLRNSTDAFLWWDYAYYNKHIYMYFGMAPILVFYLPYYNMAGYLPSYYECGLFFAFLTVIAGFLCIWEMARRYVKEAGLLQLCMGAFTAVIGSGVLMLQSMADRYHISIASEQAFWFLALWMALYARNSEGVSRRTCLVFSALFTGLMIASRPPGGIILAAWLAVLFLPILFEKNIGYKDKIFDSVSFLVPVLLCAAFIMAFNYVRFDSIFEFGAKYHLTVEDIRENKITLQHLPHALFHFFLEPLYVHSDFPWFRTVFIENNYGFVNHTGNYMLAESSMGVLAIPVVWGNLLYSRHAVGEEREKEWKTLFFLSLFAVIVTMLFEYDYGGIILRYLGDFLPSLCLTSLICLLHATRPTVLVLKDNSHRMRLFTIMCLLTLMVSFSLGFSNHRNYISQCAPDNYLRVVETFSLP